MRKDLHGWSFTSALHGSQYVSEQIPVTLWFPFCGRRSCNLKGGLQQSVAVCGQTAGRSGCSQQLDGFSFLPSDRTPSQTAAALVIEGKRSCAARLCPHYLCSSLALRLCSLSWHRSRRVWGEVLRLQSAPLPTTSTTRGEIKQCRQPSSPRA